MTRLTHREILTVIVAAVVLAAAATLPLFDQGYYLSLTLNMVMYAALCTAWTLFSGPTHYVSLATAAFFGLGTYTVGLGLDHMPFPLLVLTGGAVAICGASAAMAIAAVLPRNEHSERNLIFTVISVMLLSTTAMVAYPILCAVLGFDDKATGIFLGATIHDVAQVVGAGFSVSDTAGEAATLVKLFRVTLLAPVVLVYSLSIRRWAPGEGVGEARPPLLPGFVVGFIILAVANSVGLVPVPVAAFMVDASRWALVLGIAAVGMKTSMRSIREVGVTAIVLVVAETLFLAVFILGGLELLGHGGH